MTATTKHVAYVQESAKRVHGGANTSGVLDDSVFDGNVVIHANEHPLAR